MEASAATSRLLRGLLGLLSDSWTQGDTQEKMREKQQRRRRDITASVVITG